MKYVPVDHPDLPPPFCHVQVDGVDYFPVIDHIAIERHPPRRQFPSHAANTLRPSYLIMLVTEGEGDIAYDGRLLPVRAGMLLMSSPGIRRDLAARTPTGIVLYLLIFAYRDAARNRLDLPIRELLASVADEPLRPGGMTEMLDAFTMGRIVSSFDALHSSYRQQPIPWLAMHRRFLDVMLNLVELALLSEGNPSSVPPGLVAVKHEIDSRFQESLPLAELAVLAGMTPNYLCRRFKECYGQPPRDYQMAQQIRFAQERLRYTSYRINEIAQQAGFESHQHFSRLFKARTGLSPTQYRRPPKP